MIFELNDLLVAIGNELNLHPKIRKSLLIVFCVVDLLSIVCLLLLNYFFHLNNKLYINVTIGFIVVSSIALFIVIYSYLLNMLPTTRVAAKLEGLSNERKLIESKISDKDDSNVQDIIKLNLNQLDEYYTINKSQSKKSYNFSILTIATGFILLCITVIILVTEVGEQTLAVVTGISGVISEFIGATSLLLYKESTKHLHEFIERLTYLQRVMLAVDLMKKLSCEKQDEQTSLIISELMKR